VWPIPIAAFVFMAPDSPWWHVRNNRLEKARKMVKRLKNNADDEYADRMVAFMVHTNELEVKAQGGARYWDCFRGIDLRRTEISCLAFLCQPLSLGNMQGYATYFFETAGLPTAQAFNLSIGLYCIGFVGTCISWILMAHAGRRTIYLGGLFSIGFLFLIMGFVALASASNKAAPWVTAALLLVIVFAYDLSVGPVCFSLISEMSSTRLRAKTVSLSRGTFQVMAIINSIIFPQMLNTTAGDWKGKAGFYQFGINMVCLLWAYFRLPEPKGRTYEELDIMFIQKLPARKFKGHVVDIGAVHGQMIEDVQHEK
jgi:SP family general alpha glucoside:H+ symporter-like MFS transporter